MKKLNNKGMSIIEILLSFILVTVISGSIYSTVNAFSNKKIEEEAKFRIYTYKNILTKEIEDDIVKRGLIKVDIQGDHEPISKSVPCNTTYYDANDDTCVDVGIDPDAENIFLTQYATRYYIKLTFRSGQEKILHVVAQNDKRDTNGNMIAPDKYYVAYGELNDKILYPIPDLGYTEENGMKNYDLTISVVNTKVQNGIFFFEIRFEHTLLDQRYGIRITAPINMDAYDRNYE